MSPTPFSSLNSPEDNEVVQYRSVSSLAVAALIAGGASWLALFSPMLWAVPMAGIVLSASAMIHIAWSESALLGRKAALAGLALSVMLGAAALTDWAVYRWEIRREARLFAETWFQFLRDRQPHLAHQLTVPPLGRLPLDESLWKQYHRDSERRYLLEQYVERPDVGTLLSLGDRATVRYYDTEGQEKVQGREAVNQIYAVTWPSQSGPRTFFVQLFLERQVLPETHQAQWYLTSTVGGVRPSSLAYLPRKHSAQND